jgi:hypothetical protein
MHSPPTSSFLDARCIRHHDRALESASRPAQSATETPGPAFAPARTSPEQGACPMAKQASTLWKLLLRSLVGASGLDDDPGWSAASLRQVPSGQRPRTAGTSRSVHLRSGLWKTQTRGSTRVSSWCDAAAVARGWCPDTTQGGRYELRRARHSPGRSRLIRRHLDPGRTMAASTTH